MKRFGMILGLVILLIAVLWLQPRPTPERKNSPGIQYPNDWFFAQRAFPRGEINYPVYHSALREAEILKKTCAEISEAVWEFAGPDNIGGRITDVMLNPNSTDTIYAATASGGIFLSDDEGQTWQPIFDDALSLSIGDLAMDPSDSQTIYAGTGEVNAGGGSMTYGGFGIYKSTDAGSNWLHLGLEQTRYIARIAVDPSNSDKIFVASMGKLFATSSQRGLYRSENGGISWENVLSVSDSTGCIDMIIHPTHPDTVYAAMWERIRHPHHRSYGGVTSGLYRSADGGDTWQELTGGLPHDSPDVGRIGISLCAAHPHIVYAIYADNIGWFDGVYKTTNGGDSWSRTNDSVLNYLFGSYGWWFGNIRVDPNDPDIVFAMGLDLYKTTNSGQSWFNSSGIMHVDQHGLCIHPQNAGFVVAGNDGGIYTSWNSGQNWSKSPRLPVTQFYTCEIDYQLPQRLYGGTQDNGTIRTLTGSNSDWQSIYGGDGFYVKVDPSDNQYVYAEYQWGNLARSTNGGNSFTSATSGIGSTDRNNWNSPLTLDPADPATLYFGTHRIYKSVNRAVSWTPISPDLTGGPSTGNLTFGTVTTIDVAPSDNNVIYAGTDDSHVWVTTNGGTHWNEISQNLPVRWITRVAADPHEANTAIVTVSGYRWDEYLPHIFRSTDYGGSWTDISGNLPEAPINDVIIDPDSDATFYSAGDVGTFYTTDGGIQWLPLGESLPNVPVVDLALHAPTRTLVAATYGRSMFRLNLNDLSAVQPAASQKTPVDFTLHQNYPNPFNGATTISYRLKKPAHVVLSIFNIKGQRIAVLVQEHQEQGIHSVIWQGLDQSGHGVGSGIYLCRLRIGNQSQARKIELLQ
jgi:photosystem II stability/assembly factor-like uncharacterized protein